jgi:hypothetical protein
MNIKLVGREPQGSGKFLYVVVKRDSDNYKGLWLANSNADIREKLILDRMEFEDPNDYDEDYPYEEDRESAEEAIDYDFYWEKIGEVD